MTCKVCNETYEGVFAEDFQDGICLPCQCEASMKQWDKDVEAELNIFNALLQTGYDLNSFCYDCWQCPEKIVIGLSQSKTPILFEVYKRELDNKREYYYNLTDHMQKNLF